MLSIASQSTEKRFVALFWHLTVSKNLYLMNIIHFWSQGLKKGLKLSQKRQKCKIWTLSTKFVRSATATGKELFPIRQLLVKRKNLNWGGDTILGSQPAKKGAFHTSKVEKMLKKNFWQKIIYQTLGSAVLGLWSVTRACQSNKIKVKSLRFSLIDG